MDSTFPSPLLGTALGLHTSALSRGDGQSAARNNLSHFCRAPVNKKKTQHKNTTVTRESKHGGTSPAATVRELGERQRLGVLPGAPPGHRQLSSPLGAVALPPPQ